MQAKNGQAQQNAQLLQGGGGSGSGRKAAMLEMAAMNMSAPFYTTPDTVSSTAKTILKNIVTTMEELMDSRLRSTVSQLVRKAGGVNNSQLLFRLLSPSRKPIQVATVITRFVIPDVTEDAQQQQATNSGEEMLSIPLQFKAILDVKVFGEVSTVELSAPVTMSGKFADQHDGLLTAVDVSFDCMNLLQTMISQARQVVKTAVAKAAALSVQIAEWHAKKKAASLPSNSNPMMHSGTAASTMSLHSLLGSSISLSSLDSNCLTGLGNLFTSFSSKQQLNKHQKNSMSRGLLRNISQALANNNNKLGNFANNANNGSSNANATFDFGNSNTQTNIMNRAGSTASVVRFKMPSTTHSPPMHEPSSNNCYNGQSSLHNQVHQQQQVLPQREPSPEEAESKGNIHAGLFSWLQDDKMFLTDEKIQEQNDADAELERQRREAPMPLRFFTAAEDLGGGECGLEMVSKSIFGNGNGLQQQMGIKREMDGQQNGGISKRRKIWQ